MANGIDFWPVVEKVAAEYGCDPHSLDGGEYPRKQLRVLWKMFDDMGSNPTPEQWEAYVRQKAKFKFGKQYLNVPEIARAT